MLHTVYGHLFREHDEGLIAGLERRWSRAQTESEEVLRTETGGLIARTKSTV
jgi:hypothetical protein